MKIGVLADTHSRDIPQQLLDDFQSVDLIIHAGDFCDSDDLKPIKTLRKEFKAVYGNMDTDKIRNMFPERDILDCAGVSIGLIHGCGSPTQTYEWVKEQFQKVKVDVVIFGHTHFPLNEEHKGTLYFNPGSPNDTVISPYCSYGILTIKDGQVKAKIIKVKD